MTQVASSKTIPPFYFDAPTPQRSTMESRDENRHSLHYIRNVNPTAGSHPNGPHVHYNHSGASVIVQNAAVIGVPLASMNPASGNENRP